MTREQVEAAAIARLATQDVTAFTTDQVNAEGFEKPDTFVEVRATPAGRGVTKGSGTTSSRGWRIEADVTATLAVNANRYLDRCDAALYGHRFTIDGTVSTPAQQGLAEPASPTGDRRFMALGEWTFAL